MNFSEITYSKIIAETKDKLRKLYNKSGKIFTPASPYWQIISVIEGIFQLNMLYLKKALKQYDVTDPANNNERAIRTRAVLSGYIPNRAAAASGVISVKLKPNAINDLHGDAIIIYDKTRITNQENGLTYCVNLGREKVKFAVEPGKSFFLNVLQGNWKFKTFTGDGLPNQSYVINGETAQDVDNSNFELYVNSELWTPRKSIKDLMPGGKDYVARTSISGSLDIIFGNGHLGEIPKMSSIIEIRYLVTNGAAGNVNASTLNDFKFSDPVYDTMGNELDAKQLVDVDVATPINFGRDGESVQFIKNMLPYSSAHSIMVKPEHFEFHLKRLNMFSIVKAYTNIKGGVDYSKKMLDLSKKNIQLASKVGNLNGGTVTQALLKNVTEAEKTQKLIASQLDNTVYIYLVPNVTKSHIGKKGVNYFNIPLDAFLLDEVEKERITSYLIDSGDMATTTSLKIIDPKVTRYVLNINLRLFKNAVIENVESELRQKVSDYFLGMTRLDRIPPSDIIRLAEEVDGVDSADASFVSELNERYHAEYAARYEQFQLDNGKMPGPGDILMSDGLQYDSNKVIGLDPLFGDIIIADDELPIIRGGWQDRNGINYAETPGNSNLSSLNVMIYK